MGKETIDSFNTSETRGRELSHGLNFQKLGKELMTQDEIAVMDGGKCILQLRGVRPFFSDKYDITQHPNYKYLSDYDKKNAFDMEKHLRRRPAIVKPDEVFDYYAKRRFLSDAKIPVPIGDAPLPVNSISLSPCGSRKDYRYFFTRNPTQTYFYRRKTRQKVRLYGIF